MNAPPMPAIHPSSPQQKEWVFEQIVAFNHQTLGMTREVYSVPLNFHVRGDDGEIIAGINATMLAQSSVYVAILWVDAAYRGKDYGSHLLRHVEAETRKLGGTLIHLDTFDFQAKDFYLKLGYRLYAELADSPATGRKRYYFCKAVGAA